MVNAEIFNKSEHEQKIMIHSMLNEIFPQKEWFLNRLGANPHDTDHRCKHINLADDWFYIDDWADQFFSDHFSEQLYRQELGKRILLVNPHGDGSDILHWFDTTSRISANWGAGGIPGPTPTSMQIWTNEAISPITTP